MFPVSDILSVFGPPGKEAGVKVVKAVTGFLLDVILVVGVGAAQPGFV